MKIQYIGKSQRRIVENYVWDKSNNFTQDVKEVSLAMELITSPFDEFVSLEEHAEEKLEVYFTEPEAGPKKKRKKKDSAKSLEQGD